MQHMCSLTSLKSLALFKRCIIRGTRW